jgi:YidC/Oxa1 family membrane protein insertase
MNRDTGPDAASSRNLILAMVIGLVIFVAYDFIVLRPMNERQVAFEKAQRAAAQDLQKKVEAGIAPPTPVNQDRATVIAQAARVPVDNPQVRGSILLTGARIDDLSFKGYRERLPADSPNVTFLNPEGSRGSEPTQAPTYGLFGWTDHSGAQVVVGESTAWTLSAGQRLTPESPVTLTYATGDGLTFERTISVDDEFVFTVKDVVSNTSSTPRLLRNFGAVRRHGHPKLFNYMTLHEGFTGVVATPGANGDRAARHYEIDYGPAEKGEGQEAENLKRGVASTGGWMGITDKYWLAAMLMDPNTPVTASMRAVADPTGRDKFIYEAGYIGQQLDIPANAKVETTNRFFAGAKVVETLNAYKTNLKVDDFDKAVDWGNFWFLTRPFFAILEFFKNLIGNMGLAIMATTVVVKLAMFPLVYQSFRSMGKLKKVQPLMQELQTRYANDKARLQQEMFNLYKKEKINPAAGCIPILLQIPIFYALYKVLLVTIDLRHQPFFGWVQDLSAPDPTSWLNLFGILPFTAPVDWPIVGFLFAVGIWPILYGVSMWGVTALSPQATDPLQRRIFALMPILFTFMFAAFAAGMVIYWTWSNLLSIIQQYVIMRREGVETEIDKAIAKYFPRSGAGPPVVK